MIPDTSADDDLDFPDEEERKTAARRLFAYSRKAIAEAAFVDRVLVNHPEFKTSLQACDRVFQLGRELGLQQGAVIVGPPGVGKTALIKHFRKSLPSNSLFEEGAGALAIRCPAHPNVGHIVGSLLRQLKYPFPQVSAHSLAIKREVLIEAMRQKGTRVLFIDEAHHLKSQTKVRSRTFGGTSTTDLLREFMDEVPLGLCLSGTEVLLDLSEVDPHLESRLSARFRLTDFACDAHWYGFLKAFRRHARFDLSAIELRDEANRLHKATLGNLRQFKRLITEAVLVAVDDQREAVNTEHLKLALSRVRGTVPLVGGTYDE